MKRERPGSVSTLPLFPTLFFLVLCAGLVLPKMREHPLQKGALFRWTCLWLSCQHICITMFFGEPLCTISSGGEASIARMPVLVR